jgi:hypothetical protein
MPSILTLLETAEPPHMTMKPRAGTLSVAQIEQQLPALIPGDMPRQSRELAKAAILLWHDHFDASHEIAQDIENADGSLLHGILHRREPDLMNARYWFRRLGNAHPSFECVMAKIKIALLTARVDLVARQIAPNDKWHPLVFVDFLESCQKHNDPAYDQLLRQIQSAEIQCFVQTLPSR